MTCHTYPSPTSKPHPRNTDKKNPTKKATHRPPFCLMGAKGRRAHLVLAGYHNNLILVFFTGTIFLHQVKALRAGAKVDTLPTPVYTRVVPSRCSSSNCSFSLFKTSWRPLAFVALLLLLLLLLVALHLLLDICHAPLSFRIASLTSAAAFCSCFPFSISHCLSF